MCFLLKGLSFDSLEGDKKKEVYVASIYKNWGGWPSGMHKFIDKAWMKNVGILFTIPFQLIFNDKISLSACL